MAIFAVLYTIRYTIGLYRATRRRRRQSLVIRWQSSREGSSLTNRDERYDRRTESLGDEPRRGPLTLPEAGEQQPLPEAEEQQQGAREEDRSRSEAPPLPGSLVEPDPIGPALTRADLLAALDVEREKTLAATRRSNRQQLLVNIVLTAISLVAGWALSAYVRLP
jgi:hypothetical protein